MFNFILYILFSWLAYIKIQLGLSKHILKVFSKAGEFTKCILESVF